MRILATSAALALAAVGLAAPADAAPANAAPAQAAPARAASTVHPDLLPCLDDWSLCLWYNSNEQGSYINVLGAVSDYAGMTFTSAGAGQGLPVKNDAASATNGQPSNGSTARIFYNSNYAGVYDDVAPSTSSNLVNTYNENASSEWIAPCNGDC